MKQRQRKRVVMRTFFWRRWIYVVHPSPLFDLAPGCYQNYSPGGVYRVLA